MKWDVSLLVVALVAVAGEGRVFAEQSSPTVVLDSWWSGDYAKNGCEQSKKFMEENRRLVYQFGCEAVTACPEMMPRYSACTLAFSGPAAVAHGFEDELITQFAMSSSCKGVTVARYGPDEKTSGAAQAALRREHWTLIIDYVVGAPTQSW